MRGRFWGKHLRQLILIAASGSIEGIFIMLLFEKPLSLLLNRRDNNIIINNMCHLMVEAREG